MAAAAIPVVVWISVFRIILMIPVDMAILAAVTAAAMVEDIAVTAAAMAADIAVMAGTAPHALVA